MKTMRTFWSILLCLAVLGSCLSGCVVDERGAYVPTGDALSDADDPNTRVETPESQEPLTLVYYPEQSMNPLTCNDYTNRLVLSLLYQGLFAVDKDYQATPILCSEYAASEDMETYIFYVDSRATFSDGTRVTTADVLASLEAAWDSDLYGNRFYHVWDMYESGGGVVIELDTPYENLPLLLDVPILKATELEAANPLGTGPYMLEKSVSGVQLRRRSNWWCKSPDLAATVDSIALQEAESPSQIRNAFQFEDVSLVVTDPGSDFYADYRSDYELWDMETGIFLYLGFNHESDVLDDVDLRKLITHAIDRETICQTYYRNFAQPATLPASPSSPYYNQSLAEKYGYAPEKLKQAVINAGLVGTELTLLVNGEDSVRLRVANFIKAALEDTGLVINIVESSAYEFHYFLNMQDYDMYLAQTKLSVNMDLSQFFYLYASMSFGNMEDEATYAMCEEALANQGNYYNLHKKIMDEGRICPILFRNYAVYGRRGVVSQLNPSRENGFYYTLGLSLADIQVPMDEVE
ncbi:MAG TPA: ABC transporter substrate-binding protein [Candidatus Faecousia intestinigallinarum]|nr:ABC transporter substrate-binding protein [Candidatus Faecousia intestinigallinarum]